MPNNFFTFKNSVSGTNEILIYGEIVGTHDWISNGRDVAPQDFIEQLDALGGADVTVRINSGGGDVFAAHAIHNLLVDYQGDVTVVVDGLCASAATVVAMAGKKIVMPTNSLMMIHNPMIGLSDYYNAQELESLLPMLDAVRDSIIEAYAKRCKCSKEELADMMAAETWLTAERCVELGLADEINGTIDSTIDGSKLTVNGASYDTTNFKNMASLKNCVGVRKENDKMTEGTLKNVLNALGITIESDPVPATQNVAAVVDDVEPVDVEAIRQQAVADERVRIEALDALNDGNAAVATIVNTAKKNGASANDIQAYVDALKEAHAAQVQPAVDNLNTMIADNHASGVNAVTAEPKANDDKLKNQTAAVDALVAALNKRNGGK